MAARSKASTDGAAAQSVAETPGEPVEGEGPAAPPPAAEEASTALTAPPQPAGEPGLPSPHQNHAKNWIEKTRMDWQSFRMGHDALVSELNGLDAAHDAVQAQRQADFNAESNRLNDAHGFKREELVARINDMLDGLAITEKAIEHYNDRMKPQAEDIRDDEQREETQQQ